MPGRRPPGRGGKQRGGKQLGLKTTSPHLPAPPPSLTASTPPPSVPLLPPPVSSSSSPNPTASAPNPTVAVPTTSPTAPASSCTASASSPAAPTFAVPPRPPQGAGWGAIPPNFSSFHGNQQGSSSWYVRFRSLSLFDFYGCAAKFCFIFSMFDFHR